MKKIILMVSMVIILTIALSGYAFGEKIILTSPKGYQNVGKTVCVTTSVYDVVYGSDLSAFAYQLNYNPAVLEVVYSAAYGQSYTNITTGSGYLKTVTAYPGKQKAINTDSELMLVKFRVKGTGSESVTITAPQIADKNGNVKTPDIENLSVNLLKQGDVNGDGVVNLGDVGIASYNVGTINDDSDQNEDGVVSNQDISLIIEKME